MSEKANSVETLGTYFSFPRFYYWAYKITWMPFNLIYWIMLSERGYWTFNKLVKLPYEEWKEIEVIDD